MRGLGIAKGFDKSRTNGWFISVARADGRRPKQYYKSEKARDKAFSAKVVEVRTVGASSAKPISPTDRHALEEMVKQAEPTGLPILEIFRRGLAQLNGSVSLSTLTTAQASVNFFKEQNQRAVDKKISAVRLKEITTTLNRYLTSAGRKPLAQSTRIAIKTYLASLDVGPQTRVNHASVLSFFFRWCVDEGLLFKNPVPEQEGVSRIPTIFSNEQSAELFDCAWRRYPELLPMLGVQWYAGLRPGASHHLRWEDVDFDHRRIGIQPQGNKLRQPDVVRDLPPTVFGFLVQFRQASGLLTHPNHVELNRQLHLKLGYNGASKYAKRWPEDVARHTFASNLYSLYEQDTKRVEAVMLHATSQMLRKHYLLKNIQIEKASEYFGRHLPSA